jgi:type IV secretory pathway TraG/TraD family ATPase VirD4
VYGKDDATQMFSQPGTKFFFRPRTLEVAEKISKMAGMTTVYERKMTSSGHIQERESGRPLIDPGEVLALPEEEMIVFTPKCPPLKMPRFTWEDYKDSMAIPPLPKMEVMVDERLVKECNALKEKTEWQERGEEVRKQEQEGKPKQQAKPEQKPQNSNQGAPKKNRNRFKERQQRPKDERQEAQEKPKPRVIESQEIRTKQEKNKGTSYD